MFSRPAVEQPSRRPFATVPSGGVLMLLGSCLLASCLGDAERGNPLDPRSDNFQDTGGVPGSVVRASAPAMGVPGASVRLEPQAGGTTLVAHADADGDFAFAGVPSGTYLAIAEAPGFSRDSATVDVVAGRLSPQVTLSLNALPLVTAQSVRSERINRWFPEPFVFSQIVVEATIVEPDGAGDLVSVEFVIPDFDHPGNTLFRATLFAVPNTSGVFRRVILEEDLPVPLQELLGRNLHVEARDQSGAVTRSTDTHVVRIVEAIPQTVFPQNPGDVVSVPFTLTWDAMTLPYAFTWRVEIFFVPAPGLEQPLTPINGIPPSQTSVSVTTPLQPGNYAWRISAVDEFGNSARSREAGFRVDP